MPCEICLSPLYIDDSKEICLKCEHKQFLPKYEAEMISNYRIGILNGMLSAYISQKNKYKLVTYLMDYRERMASNYFQEMPVLDAYNLLAINILIKRVMKWVNPNGSTELESIEDFVDIFSKFLRICEENIFIEEGLATYIYNVYIPFGVLGKEEALSNYKIVYREEWKSIAKSYENELFMNKESAKTYLKEHENEYKKAKKSQYPVIKYSPKVFIEKVFPAIASFYAVFQKNVLFAKMFDFEYLSKAGLTLNDINNVIMQFPYTGNTKLMVVSESDDFEKRLLNSTTDADKIKNNLLMDDKNTEIFPFFVKIFAENKEMILITPNFYKLLFLLLHALFYKDIFNSEKERRSKTFEKDIVKKEFESRGYKYLSNIKDKKKPSLQIDGIAYNDKTMHICEIKLWGIRPFFDQLRIHSYITRDLMGVVDGKKYTTKNGVLLEERIPSLLEKIEFVKLNKKKLGISNKERTIQGIVITSLTPIKKEYKRIKFISVDEIKNI